MSKSLLIRGRTIGQGAPKIVVPIVGKTKDGILSSANRIHEMKADIVEWRVDWFSGGCDIASVKNVLPDLRDALGEIPLLFTFRTAKEGGEAELPPDSYAELTKSAVSTGLVDLVDVELFTGEEYVKVGHDTSPFDPMICSLYVKFQFSFTTASFKVASGK